MWLEGKLAVFDKAGIELFLCRSQRLISFLIAGIKAGLAQIIACTFQRIDSVMGQTVFLCRQGK